MKKPRVLIFSGYGLNCEEETKFAFELSGAIGEIVHINDLIEKKVSLDRYQIIAFPGGFSYGDDTGSGKAFANKIKNHLLGSLKEYTNKDHLVIGICNGFQILTNLGLLGDVALTHNDNARYTVRWVDLEVQNDSPWLIDIKNLSLPIAHGEGKFYASEQTLKKLNESSLVALRYVNGEICEMQNLEANPNGSLENIAAITDDSKKILGLMPHPERAVFFTQMPFWENHKEECKRQGKTLPKDGPGIQLFKNAVKYFK